MYDYTICNLPDESLFYRQCEALEKNIPGLIKEEFLEDVDSSLIQRYEKDGKKIKVYNDIDVGALYVKSEIELTQYFPKGKAVDEIECADQYLRSVDAVAV
jgi:hypothetical protein